jgi:probable DNA repair protein
MIHAAFSLLEFVRGDVPLPLAGTLLRSPFLCGADNERSARAALDARLRRRGIWNVSLALLRDQAGSCPELQRIAHRAHSEIAKIEQVQRASEWASTFSKILRAFGWPGERSLSSREYQVADAWQSVLSTFAELDTTAPPFPFENAMDALRDLAGGALFQVENEGAPVQIMGVLEASGLSFDHLWVMGLHDEALPATARPNPFLPLSMQREYRLPHASAGRELEFAKKILARLLASAPDVVLSYPAQEGEQTLLPTPLLGAMEWLAPGEHATHGWAAAMRGTVALDPLDDEVGPLMPDSLLQKGGTTLFKDMAACPFRAFVQHRLNARPLDDPAFGLDARDKGKLVHKALELIWIELQTHERLCSLGPVALSEVVSRNVKAALDQQSGGLGRSLEQVRLEHLLMEWLEIEKQRPPFSVLGPEQKRLVNIGGLAINLRIDRVDELPGGGQIILDYKTGEVKGSAWMGDRPTEPQVPLYCATSSAPVAGAALVQIHAGDLKVRGLDQSSSFPDLKRMQTAGDGTLPEQVEEWKRVLAALAERFRAGHAEVDPLPGACDYCGVTALCRIRELERA